MPPRFPQNKTQTPVEWRVSDGVVPYLDAVAAMEQRAADIAAGEARECVWLLEHPPLYTSGTSIQGEAPDLPFPVYSSGRGGQWTYHGPRQRIAYVMLNLEQRTKDVRLFVQCLEQWLIETLALMNIKGERREDRVGVWVARNDGSGLDDKIAALGIRVRRWVSFHGLSLNVAPDLTHFNAIVPCGIKEHGVTSLESLGHLVSMPEIDSLLKQAFATVFEG
jgi:lipoyl(octanoyl) transferase